MLRVEKSIIETSAVPLWQALLKSARRTGRRHEVIKYYNTPLRTSAVRTSPRRRRAVTSTPSRHLTAVELVELLLLLYTVEI